ncbi:hypothetical protein GWN26_15915, partial [Candidatus Saccharibacteria bacterium]|nr:hypothetical protein [Candidatus Saccharibacteria bacterium]
MSKNKSSRKIFSLLLILPILGLVVFSFLEIDIFAKTETQELDRLFSDMGVLATPFPTDPVEVTLKDLNGQQVSLSD